MPSAGSRSAGAEARRRRDDAKRHGQRVGTSGLSQEQAIGAESFARRYFRTLGELFGLTVAEEMRQRMSALAVAIADGDGALERATAEADELKRQAHDADERADEAARREEAYRIDRENLPRLRRGNKWDVGEVLAAGGALIAVDTFILDLTQEFMPGEPLQHRLTAIFISICLFAYAHAVGWLADLAVTRLGERGGRVVIGLGALLLCLLPIPGLLELQEFRSETLTTIASMNELPIADPRFFGAIQFMTIVAAAITSFRWFAGKDGRELLERIVACVDIQEEERDTAEELREEAAEILGKAQRRAEASAAADQEIDEIEKALARAREIGRIEGELLESLYAREYELAYAQKENDTISVPIPYGRATVASVAGAVVAALIGLLVGAGAAAAGVLAITVALTLFVTTTYVAAARREPIEPEERTATVLRFPPSAPEDPDASDEGEVA